MKVKDLKGIISKIDPETDIYIQSVVFNLDNQVINNTIVNVNHLEVNSVVDHATGFIRLGLMVIHTEKVSKETEIALKKVN